MTDQVEETPSGVEEAAEGDVNALREELARVRNEAASFEDKYLRARADMDNFRKRMERNYADMARAERKQLLTKLLTVRDNMERALQYGEGEKTNGESIIEGVRLTQYQLDTLLQQEGVKPMGLEGKPYDPHLAEAIHSVDDQTVPDGTVVQVVRTGYTLDDEVLRAAQVVVSVHPGDDMPSST